uniref:hypothetical protein n=1 Tax=Nitrogeniibacter mangrovi TaxID=2016596 RepID=UPI00389912A2
MDLLALYQPRANAPLDDLAKLMGFPGKLGMDGSRSGAPIRTARSPRFATTARPTWVNTYLVYLRFQKMRGVLSFRGIREELGVVRQTLSGIDAPHWKAFLAEWA